MEKLAVALSFSCALVGKAMNERASTAAAIARDFIASDLDLVGRDGLALVMLYHYIYRGKRNHEDAGKGRGPASDTAKTHCLLIAESRTAANAWGAPLSPSRP